MEYLSLISLCILAGILNRLRGTGVLKHFGTLHMGSKNIEIKLVWNHIYGLYFGLIFGYISGSILIGFLTLIAYLIGESKGWGEWVGALTTTDVKDEEWLQKQYKDNEGIGFPFIHQIANWLEPEQIEGTLEERLEQYNKYATLALTLRGIYWFLPMMIVAIVAGLVSWYVGLVSLVLVGIGFPLACFIGKIIKYRRKLGVLEFRQGWENQEVIYGIIQGVCIVLPIVGGW